MKRRIDEMEGRVQSQTDREKESLKQGLAYCGRILAEIFNDYRSEEFRQPVDWNYLKLFDYPVIIKQPMDLGSIRRKLQNNEYSSIFHFNEDMQLVWNNAQLYNQPGSPIHEVAVVFQNQWQEKFTRLQNILRASEDLHQEKHAFLEKLKQLNPDQLGTVVEMIQKQCHRAINETERSEHIQIEVDSLDVKTLRSLLQYCESCHEQAMKKKKRKTNKPKSPPAAPAPVPSPGLIPAPTVAPPVPVIAAQPSIVDVPTPVVSGDVVGVVSQSPII